MQPIYTQIVTNSGGASSITFNNIPQTFTDIKVELSGQNTTTSGACIVRFNSVTTGYSIRRLLGNGSSASSDNFSEAYFLFTNSSDFGTSNYSASNMYVANYTSANFKQVICDVVQPRNATNGVQALIAGLWSNTQAITSISITPTGGNIAQYSTVTLYGITKG